MPTPQTFAPLSKSQLSQLNDGIQGWIVRLSNYLGTSTAAQSLPVIGSLARFVATEQGELTAFGKAVGDAIAKTVATNTVPTLSQVSGIINAAFKTAGIQATVNLNGNTGSIRLNLEAKVSGTYNQSLSADLGLGSLVALSTSGTLKAGAGIDLKLTCGVDSSGFYVDTKRNTYTLPGGTSTLLSGTALTLSTTDYLTGITAKGRVGSLNADLTMGKTSYLGAAINLDLGTTLAGGLLRSDDFTNLGNLTVTPALSGSLDLDMALSSHLTATNGAQTLNLLPLKSEEVVHWNFATQSSPDILLSNTTLALGPVFQSGGLIATILTNVATIASAIDPVVQALGKDIPGLPDSSFLALVASSQNITAQQKQDIASFVSIFQGSTSFLKDLPKVDPAATLRLPDYQINGIAAASLPFATPDSLSGSQPVLEERPTALPVIPKAVSDFLSKISLGSFGTLSLPVLSDPQTLANLIIGKETNLVQWDLPPVEATFNADIAPFLPYPAIPVSLAAGVSGSFSENLGIGYDSRGLINFQNGGDAKSLADGIYLYNPQSTSTLPGNVLSAGLTVTPSAALGAGSALSASVSGSVSLRGGVSIQPDSLGNYHPFTNGTTDSLAPAFATAMLAGGIQAEVTLVGYTKSIDVLPDTVLLNYQYPNDSLLLGPGTTLEGGNLRLNVGVSSSLNGNFDNPAGGDTLRVTHYLGNAGSEQLGLAVNGSPKTVYKATKSLVGSASSGNLTILEEKSSVGMPIVTPLAFDGGNANLTFVGGAANDTLRMGDGNSVITPGTGAKSVITVGSGTNAIHMGLGNASITGGRNTTVSFDLALKSPVSVNLATGSLGGAAAGDFIHGIPNITGTYLGDTLTGGGSAGTLTGGRGNDLVTAGSAGSTLIGALPGSSTPGLREIDTLQGSTASDLFVLGDASSVYYLSGLTRGGGKGDYALIRNFNPSLDKLQLKGDSSTYLTALVTMNGMQGLGVYYDTTGGGAVSQSSELISIIEPDANHPLSSLNAANTVQQAQFV